MANRRMFSKNIIDTDKFLSLSNEAKLLYFYLGLQADDDGFIGSPIMRARILNIKDNVLEELVKEDFIIYFMSGCIVITDWKENNYIQKDRYNPTIYKKEFESLRLENNRYIADVYNTDTDCKPSVYTGKDRLELGKDKINNNVTDFDENTKEYELSNFLYEKIKANDPKTKKPNLKNWAKDIDKLLRIDKRTYEEIKEIIDFATSHHFWKTNILSTKSLRAQFQKLYLQSKANNNNGTKELDNSDVEKLYPNWKDKPLNV